jgi:CO/xanthine dehydrogenase FAD-binding subunit
MQKAYRPKDLSEALECRAATQGTIYAGGTDIMARQRQWGGETADIPAGVIYVWHLPELRRFYQDAGCLFIGACMTIADLKTHSNTPALLREILGSMASPAIRNLATIGGNICNASPAGDTLPYLYAMEARVVCQTNHGQREIPIERFISGPGKIDLAPDEILTTIVIPDEHFSHTFHKKVAARRANTPSKVSMIGLASKENKKITDLRLAFGAAGPTVVRSRKIELAALDALAAADQSKQAMEEMLAALERRLCPIDDQRSTAQYRKDAALRLAADFLQSLYV